MAEYRTCEFEELCRLESFCKHTVYVQSGAEKSGPPCSLNTVDVNCCSTMVSFLQNVDTTDSIWRR